MDPGLFDQVGDAVRGLVPPELGPVRLRSRRYSVKAWFGATEPPNRQHYEAQIIGHGLVDDAKVLAIEVGFHAEHPDPVRNEDLMTLARRGEPRWRAVLGSEPEVGSFLGRPDDWRRVSETWPDPDLDDPELPLEVAMRLTDYIAALEPVLRQ